MKRIILALVALLLSPQAFALTAADVAAKFPLCFGQNAGSPYIRSIPTASQIGIQNGAASLNDGFPPLTFTPIAAGGVPPFGQDMNGILNETSCSDQWVQAGGSWVYDGSFSSTIGGYPKGSVLPATPNFGNYWLSIVDNNTADPDSGGSNWEEFTPLTMYSTDTGTANSGVVTLPLVISTLSDLLGHPIVVAKTSAANTGAYTLTANSHSAQVRRADGSTLAAGELPASSTFTVAYTGTFFYLLSPTGSAALKTASNPANSTVASVNGATVAGDIPSFNDTTGTIKDSTLNAAAMPLDWISFSYSSGVVVIARSSANISVARNSTGNYTVTEGGSHSHIIAIGNGSNNTSLNNSQIIMNANNSSCSGTCTIGVGFSIPSEGSSMTPVDPPTNANIVVYGF